MYKCVIGASEVDLNGHRISGDGILPLQSNVQGIMDIPTPTNAKQLTRFICRNCRTTARALEARFYMVMDTRVPEGVRSTEADDF